MEISERKRKKENKESSQIAHVARAEKFGFKNENGLEKTKKRECGVWFEKERGMWDPA